MRTTGAPPTVVQRAVHGTKLEQWSDERVSNHWKRNKKAAVDLLELPVAIDRQLEDERLLMQKNRNPQINAPTKMDKVRSEQIIAKVGSTRSVAVKAAVLNKIVREASGVNTYVITAPPRSLEDKPEDISDPDTNPHFKAYAKETKKKPIIMSFGHRPRSASRTFNPATMRFRMRHGEMVKTDSEGQYGFGLPVGVLAKILKAPKISNNGTFGAQGNGDDDTSMEDAAAASRYDPHDLFSLPGSPGEGLEDSVSELQQGSAGAESWVSQTQQSIELGGKRRSSGRTGAKGGSKKPPPAAKTTGAEDASDVSIGGESKQYNRDLHELPWDSAHHHVRLTHKELFLLKQNVMPNQPITLPERMARFGAKTIADELTPFCREKQDLDMKILRAGPSAPPPTFKISPPKGLQRMHDPNNLNLNYVKKRREELERKQESAWKAKEFSMDLLSVPKVSYHPESLSLQLQTGVIKLKEIGPIVAEVPALEWEDFRPPSELEVFLQEQADMRKKIKDEYDAKRDRREQKMGQKTTYGQPRPSLKPLASSSSVSSLALAVPHSSQSLAVSAGSSSLATGIAGVASQTEVDLVNAIKKAKKGNKRALFDLFLGGGGGGGAEGVGIGSLAGSLSSTSNDGAAQVEAWVREREAWESNASESEVAGSLGDLLLAQAPRPLTAKEERRAAEENIEALLAQAAESKRQARAAADAAAAAVAQEKDERKDTEALSPLDKETRDTFEAMEQMRLEEQFSDPQAFVAHVIQLAMLRFV